MSGLGLVPPVAVLLFLVGLFEPVYDLLAPQATDAGCDEIDERERKFLRELKHEAKRISPEFQQLHDECMTGSARAGQ